MNYLRELKGTFLAGAGADQRLVHHKYSSSAYQTRSLFDVKVLYVKVSGCSTHEAPEVLRVFFPPRSIQTSLEVNGGRISPSEPAALTLRRDRVTTESTEVTYVSTEHLRLLGSIAFEVKDEEEVLVSGTIERSENASQEETSCWSIECNSGIASPGSGGGTSSGSGTGCGFLRGKGDIVTPPPALEICIVGDYAGSPLVLTQTVNLSKRRRCLATLDAIPEDEENNLVLLKPLEQLEQTEITEQDEAKQRFYTTEGLPYIENDDGEMTWFNAGVRVGVGIGLGMCLGLGIGAGLLIRTYQATTRTFRRRLF